MYAQTFLPRPALKETALQALRDTLDGILLTAEDATFDEARRIWNGMIDRHPALIARCASEDDVVACVQFAREQTLPLAVRGGGHNVAGSALCEGGIVIDLSLMKSVRVDAGTHRVHAQGGVTIGELDRATQPFGLAAPMGVVTETGIAGLTLGGGMGWLRRKHGLSCDALRSVNIVTADGRLRYASEDENADLFWAVRGGGGNFGVVTRFEYELYDVGPDVFFLLVFYPASMARDVLQYLRTYMKRAVDAFSPLAVLAQAPAVDAIPRAYHGEPCLILAAPYIGEVEEGVQTLAALRELGTPIADLSDTVPYLQVQQFFDEDYPSGGRYYWKSTNLTALEDEAIDHLIALNSAAPSVHSTIDLWFQGGALGRVRAEATAFGDRSAPVMIGIEANWHDKAVDEVNIAWARRCYEAMQPFSDGSMYFNFPGSEEEAAQQVQTTYGANYERLAVLKRTFDPDNVFQTHQNIVPAIQVDHHQA